MERSGEETNGFDDDPLVHLFGHEAAASTPIHEPSAEQRMQAAARSARAADLQRRLAEEAQRDASERAAQLSRARRSKRAGRFRRILGPVVVVALVASGGLWYTQRDSSREAVRSTLVRSSDSPPADTSASPVPLGVPPPAPDPAGPFEFVATQSDGTTPVAWDPCRPVRYVVNPAGAPANSQDLVEEAVARTAEATGLTFTFDGNTDEPWSEERDAYQPDRYGNVWAPVLISWGTEAETPDLAGNVAGFGGPSGLSVEGSDSVNVSGQIVLDAADLGPRLDGSPGGRNAVRSVIQHELGHVMGLDHVTDPAQLMYAEGNDAQGLEWGNGDLAGLHQLGSGECFPDI